MRKIVLASGSERRRDLLGWLELDFEVIESGFDESVVGDCEVEELVTTLAFEKAMKVVREGLDEEGGVVVGADTIVVIEEQGDSSADSASSLQANSLREISGQGEEVLGKPKDEQAAIKMLKRLSGRKHEVLTGVAVVDSDSGEKLVEVEKTTVEFRSLSDKEIEEYVLSGEPMGKAGSYAIQGGAGKFLAGLEGSFTNVVGLPLVRLVGMLEEMGIVVEVSVEEVVYSMTGFRS